MWPNKSKEIRPVIAIPASIIAFGVTYVSLNNVVVGLKTGKIAWSVKDRSGVAIEADSLGTYWFHVVEYSVLGLVFACITIWMLRHAWRGLRK
jgi:hypothetical protein